MSLAGYARRAGESEFQFMERRRAEWEERVKREDAERAAYLAKHGAFKRASVDLPLGVGTFDANGNAKGSGW